MRTRLLIVTAALSLLASVPGAWAVSGHLEGYIPSAAHADGKFGSFWTTDVWIYQQGATVIHLWYNPAGQDNSDGESLVVSLDDPVVHFTDIVGSLFGAEGVGSVHYLADGPVTVVSRTWTAAPDGGGYGQTIPGIPLASGSFAGSGQGGALRLLVNQRSGFRANLGLVNVSPVALTVAVEIFTLDGQPAAGDPSFTVDLPPFDMTQINDVLRKRLGPSEREGLIIRVGVISAEGAVMAYLSEVDNTTNDASYQEAFRFAF
jgi:hypothetical protein